MSDLYNQIVDDRGSLERLVARIPGFNGYMERSARRTADRLLRDYIASQMALRIKRFASLEKQLLDAGHMNLMSKTRRIKSRMQTYHDKIKTAAPKHSGFFEKVKIGADELERIYRFDEAQIHHVEQFDPVLEQMEAAIRASADIEAVLTEFDALCDDVDKAFAQREDVIIQLGTSI
ncbi:MAG: hypothetical protein D6737_03900 [Chloroflexi bacterium]|nr:MAG: hypothetical protein CUN54_00575 [Phototrophicales bacterium]RMF81788.1 MAG: hypothetical protein D6737_03900 [Chloroflexota bacterium]